MSQLLTISKSDLSKLREPRLEIIDIFISSVYFLSDNEPKETLPPKVGLCSL
jgi:hypothetical protein